MPLCGDAHDFIAAHTAEDPAPMKLMPDRAAILTGPRSR
jgi:hypothetical protein